MDKKFEEFDLEDEMKRLNSSKELKIEDNSKKKIVKVVAKKEASSSSKKSDAERLRVVNGVSSDFEYDISNPDLENSIKTLEESNIVNFLGGKDSITINTLYDKPITEVRKVVEGLGLIILLQ